MTNSANEVHLRLSLEEALVLFELLSRWIHDDGSATPGADCFVSSAECSVLSGALADLEGQLVAPLSDEYNDQLARARLHLATGWQGKTLRG